MLRQVAPLAAYAVLVSVLFVLHSGLVWDPPYLLPMVNTAVFVLIALVSTVMAVFGFIHGGDPVVASLGAGVYVFGLANVIGPLLLATKGPDAAVASHNILSLVASFLFLHSVAGHTEYFVPVPKRWRLARRAFLGATAAVAIVTFLSAAEALPVFINAAGQGSALRTLVLGAAIVVFGASSIIAAMLSRPTGEAFLRWYSLGLGFVTLGLASVSLGVIGSPLSWAGRIAQLVGQAYILAGLYVAMKQKRASRVPTGAAVAESFRRVQEALSRSRAQLHAAIESMTDAVFITDTGGRVVTVNDAFVRFFRFPDRQPVMGHLMHDPEIFDVWFFDGRPSDESMLPVARALRGETASNEEYVVRRKDTGETWIGSYSLAPIRDDSGGITGAVVVARDISELKLAEAEMERLLDLEKRRRSLIEALHGVMEVAVSSLDTSEAAEKMLRYLVENHGFELANIWLAVSDHLELLSFTNYPEEYRRLSPMSLASDHDSARVFKSGEAVFVPDSIMANPAVLDRHDSIGVALGAYAIVPLRASGRTIGTLMFGWSKPHPILDDDRQFYLSLGHELGVVLENARLYQSEHKIAETLQETLVVLPSHVPGVTFSRAYESATYQEGRVGGDFVDIFEVHGNWVGITLGDVSGKGIEAAVTTSLIRTTLRVLAIDGIPPGEVANKANRVMRRFSETDAFATLWFGLLNTRTGLLRYVSAGHPPALVITAGEQIRHLEYRDPILGAFDETSYRDYQTTITSRDKLVLYSDGLTEARSASGEFLGEDGLIRILESHAAVRTDFLAQMVIEDVISFSDGVLRDDAAILAVEPIKLRKSKLDEQQMQAFPSGEVA